MGNPGRTRAPYLGLYVAQGGAVHNPHCLERVDRIGVGVADQADVTKAALGDLRLLVDSVVANHHRICDLDWEGKGRVLGGE